MIRKREKVVVFGFGAQGKAWAQNLSDSGMDVTVCLRANSKKIALAKKLKLKVSTDPVKCAKHCDVACMMIPDAIQSVFYKLFLEKNLRANSAVVFAHGMAIATKLISPRTDIDFLLVAPLAHGDAVRSEYTSNGNVACMLAVAAKNNKRALLRAKKIAKALSPKGPFINSTFKEEFEMDLFIEQSLLCGGLAELTMRTFEVLANAGYNKLSAYYSCIREIKPIVNLIEKFGPTGMLSKISDAAAFGALTRGPRLINKQTTKEMKNLLNEIRSGSFVKEFLKDARSGNKKKYSLLEKNKNHELQKIHDRRKGA